MYLSGIITLFSVASCMTHLVEWAGKSQGRKCSTTDQQSASASLSIYSENSAGRLAAFPRSSPIYVIILRAYIEGMKSLASNPGTSTASSTCVRFLLAFIGILPLPGTM